MLTPIRPAAVAAAEWRRNPPLRAACARACKPPCIMCMFRIRGLHENVLPSWYDINFKLSSEHQRLSERADASSHYPHAPRQGRQPRAHQARDDSNQRSHMPDPLMWGLIMRASERQPCSAARDTGTNTGCNQLTARQMTVTTRIRHQFGAGISELHLEKALTQPVCRTFLQGSSLQLQVPTPTTWQLQDTVVTRLRSAGWPPATFVKSNLDNATRSILHYHPLSTSRINRERGDFSEHATSIRAASHLGLEIPTAQRSLRLSIAP